MTYTDNSALPQITEQKFIETLEASTPYTVMILKAGPNFKMPGRDRDSAVASIIREHGKRNVALRAAGLLPIVCPIADGSGVTGIGVFNASPDDVKRIMSDDPGVKAGVFTYDVHPSRSFPGSMLPAPDQAGRQ